mgnify:CR=1 FL=1
MRNLLACFLVGVVVGYLSANFFESKAENQDSEIKSPRNKEVSNTKKTVIVTTKIEKQLETNSLPEQPTTEHEYTSLEEENTALKNKYKALQERYRKSVKNSATLERQIRELSPSTITNEQLAELVPKEFAPIVTGSRGTMRESIFEFHQEDDDLDWGYQMSMLISDFVSTHLEANSIRPISVKCKIDRCEGLFSMDNFAAAQSVMEDMRKQPWFKFTSSNSSSTGENENSFLYLFTAGYQH